MVFVVDDILMLSNSYSLLKDLEEEINTAFQVELLGEANSFIVLDIERDKNVIKVRQTKYVEKILNEFGLLNANITRAPLPAPCDLGRHTKNEGVLTTTLHSRYR